MARFKYDEAEHYGGQGGSGFFYLRDDGEVATVRFMYGGIDDVEGLSVHQIELDGKKRYVNCLREYNQPVDDCPFCRARMFTSAKLFIPIYDVDDGSVKIWERGKKFFSKMSSLCSRYPDIVSHVFEIERNGKKGDTATTYEIYEQKHDDCTLEDLPELPKVLGGLVLDKSAEDMEYFLLTEQFPPETGEEDDAPVRRRGRREVEEERPVRRHSRRTPANKEKF